jgi:23S rRNA pseudoU1915 N3-methylase RlmH
MRCFQTIAILFIFGNLTGCQSVEHTTAIPFTNEEKDKYIEKVEGIISDSASALTVVASRLDKGLVRELTEAQVTRLSGLSKPSVAKVEEYSRMLNQNDSKAVQKDKEEASKVDQQTNELWSMVEERDAELDATKVALAQAEQERKLVFKEKVLWLLTCVGMAVSTAGLLVIAFTPWKTRGLILIAGGATAVASVWVLDSEWFKYILITIACLGVCDLVWLTLRWQLGKRSKVQGELQN